MVEMCLFFSRSTITLAAISSIGQVNAYIFFFVDRRPARALLRLHQAAQRDLNPCYLYHSLCASPLVSYKT